MVKIEKSLLGVAGEYAVASELCRNNIYAQLTLGNRKKTDLLLDNGEEMRRIQVKSKQGNVWPGCRGVSNNDFLVLVDYYKKKSSDKPDFYILTSKDWINVLKTNYQIQLDNGDLSLSDGYIPVWRGDGYVGHSLPVKQVLMYKDRWDKIIDFFKY